MEVLRHTTRRIELTEIGQRLYHHGRSIQGELLAASESISSLGHTLHGRVRVGVPSGYCQLVMAEWQIDFTEDFKLSSGTWVSVGPLRARLLAALATLAHDAVIAGLNRDFLVVLIVPDLRACAQALGQVQAGINPVELVNNAVLRRRFGAALKAHAHAHPGNSTCIERAIVLADPLSLDHGDITDKGSVNQRAVLARRDALVQALYYPTPPPHVLIV